MVYTFEGVARGIVVPILVSDIKGPAGHRHRLRWTLAPVDRQRVRVLGPRVVVRAGQVHRPVLIHRCGRERVYLGATFVIVVVVLPVSVPVSSSVRVTPMVYTFEGVPVGLSSRYW